MESHPHFRVFFDQYYPVIYRNFRARIKDWSLAEELAQETFFRASRSMDPAREEYSLAWLTVIADNVFKNWLRYRYASKRDGVEQPIEESESGTPYHDPKQEKALILKQRMDGLKLAIEALSPQMRRCFTLFYLNEYKYEEIALLLGISVQTVKSQLSRARHKVADSLKKDHQEVGKQA
ncbi:RNA polymerase sigma factor [Sulfidibacter corallicola]|nr:RNA polymerase sigma factor [Sulfidibacter corallicola]